MLLAFGCLLIRFKIKFSNTNEMTYSLNPDQAQYCIGLDLYMNSTNICNGFTLIVILNLQGASRTG